MSAFSLFWSICDGEVEAQTRTWEEDGGAVEFVAEGSDGTAAMRGAKRMQSHAQFAISHDQIGGAGEGRLDEGSPLLMCSRIMRRN